MLFADASTFACAGGDVSCVESRSLVPTFVRARAESIPWIGIAAVSTHTRDGLSFPLPKSNLAVTTCRHLGAMVTSWAVLTSHDLLCHVVSFEAWLSSLGLLAFGSLLVWRSFTFSAVSLGNTVKAACFVDMLSHMYGALLMPTKDNSPRSKLISAPAFYKKSTEQPILISGEGTH